MDHGEIGSIRLLLWSFGRHDTTRRVGQAVVFAYLYLFFFQTDFTLHAVLETFIFSFLDRLDLRK